MKSIDVAVFSNLYRFLYTSLFCWAVSLFVNLNC